MKTIDTVTPIASFNVQAYSDRLASFCRAVTEQAAALALLCVLAVVLFFIAIGVVSMVLELTRALAMAGPLGLVALALTAAVTTLGMRHRTRRQALVHITP